MVSTGSNGREIDSQSRRRLESDRPGLLIFATPPRSATTEFYLYLMLPNVEPSRRAIGVWLMRNCGADAGRLRRFVRLLLTLPPCRISRDSRGVPSTLEVIPKSGQSESVHMLRRSTSQFHTGDLTRSDRYADGLHCYVRTA